MKALSLFSGIGGIDLAAEWAGIETVAFCEREPFCQKVLAKHWPHVPIYDDVRTLTKERLEADGIDSGTIGLIHGGYPCQPFSLAGKRKGTDDDRHLWPEVKRLLKTIRPRWFVGENVAGHITMGLDDVLNDLGDMQYTAQTFHIPAAAVGKKHRRYRVFILAHNNNMERETLSLEGWRETVEWKERAGKWCENRFGTKLDNTHDITRETSETIQINLESYVCRIVDGISYKLDESRLTALGNSVVPQQIYPFLQALKQIDDMLKGA